MYSNNKTYRFDQLDGWDDDSIARKVEEIKAEERKAGEGEGEGGEEV